MISQVLVPMDDSEMAEAALRYALEAHPDASITVLHVVGEPSGMMGKAARFAIADDIEDAAREHARTVLERADEIASEYGRTVSTEVEWGHPVRRILDRAEEFDTIVIGSHGGTVAERLFVGNVAETIFRRSPIPVTTVR